MKGRIEKDQRAAKKKTRREKNSKCYICKEKGHAFWACESRKRIAVAELNQEAFTTSNVIDEEAKYPETVHVIGDYMVEGTNLKTWNEIWYVSNKYKFHLCPRRKLFKKINYKFKMIGKEETERKFIFSYGIGHVSIETENGIVVIPNLQYTPEVFFFFSVIYHSHLCTCRRSP